MADSSQLQAPERTLVPIQQQAGWAPELVRLFWEKRNLLFAFNILKKFIIAYLLGNISSGMWHHVA
jgi:hypothetical protein